MKERIKPIWHNCETMEVTKVVLEVTGDNNGFIHRIRLETESSNDITFKPRKEVIETGDVTGFTTTAKRSDMLTISEFVLENPAIKLLSENCKKSPQKITLTYATIEGFDEEKQETVYYNYMRDKQFKTIYYELYHKKDENNIKAQEDAKKKYEEKNL